MKITIAATSAILLAAATAQRGLLPATLQLERQHSAQVAAAGGVAGLAQPGRQQEQMMLMQQQMQQSQHLQQDAQHAQLQQRKSIAAAAGGGKLAVPAPVVGTNRARRPPPALRKRQTAAQASPQALLGPVTPPKGKPIDKIPMLGLGTFGFFTRRSAVDAISSAFQKGFRHIDSAMIYQNEPHVGAGIAEGLRRNGLKREDVWVTTKLWNNRHGNMTQQGLQESLKRMNLTYVDLYLMHFPVGQTGGPAKFDHVETWKEMEKLITPGGPVRHIGVSNFSPKQMTELLAAAKIRPFVHQFEAHPYLQQRDFVAWHQQRGIAVVGYAPLANTSPYYAPARLSNPSRAPVLIENPVLVEIGKARGCSGAQVALAWNMRRGVAVIPKAGQPAHQLENVGAWDKCKLTEDDNKKIEAMAKRWTGRFNNPCKSMRMPCFEGLEEPTLGNNPVPKNQPAQKRA